MISDHNFRKASQVFDFHKFEKERVKSFLSATTSCRYVTVLGDLGVGKSTSIRFALRELNVPYIIISFRSELINPLQSFDPLFENKNGLSKENILIAASQLLQTGHCLVFENFELCTEDSHQIIKQLFEYHSINNCHSAFIFEYNKLENCDLHIEHRNKTIEYHPIKELEMRKYFMCIFLHSTHNEKLFEKLLIICKGNLKSLELSINILMQRSILSKKNGKYFFLNSSQIIPNSLLSLYIMLFTELEEHIKRTLQRIAPLGRVVYAEIIKKTFDDCIKIDSHLDELSAYESFIVSSEEETKSSLFGYAYYFNSDIAIDAVIEKTAGEHVSEVISKLYEHLSHIYHNPHMYSQLSDHDKLLLLQALTKMRNKDISVTHVVYIADLMDYYFSQALYHCTIEQANKALLAPSLNPQLIDRVDSRFFVMYFEALLCVGEYETIISYQNAFDRLGLNYLIAVAHYNIGNPNVALDIIDQIKMESGHSYSLRASIYDWLGNNELSERCFAKALRLSKDDSELKYQLYKKYSMHIDFNLPECKERMFEAMHFYKKNNLKQYAECLHNIGTGYMLNFEFKESEEYLEDSKKYLSDLCDKELYYPLNSIAMGYCLKQNFKVALEIFQDIDLSNVNIDFCKLAILNNSLAAAIQIDFKSIEIKNMIDSISLLLQSLCTISDLQNAHKKRPDIQHQIRHFYLNCANLYEKKNEPNMALEFYTMALQASKYESKSSYAIEKSMAILKKRKFDNLTALFRGVYQPNKLESYFYEHKIYLCEVMFWG